jgi:hypothetical protein
MSLRCADIVVEEGLDNGSCGDDGFLSIYDNFILASFNEVLAAVLRGIVADELSEISRYLILLFSGIQITNSLISCLPHYGLVQLPQPRFMIIIL